MSKELHHFVPRFYLRQFIAASVAPREMVWVYERGKSTPELRALDHIAARKDYYAIEVGDGRRTKEVEKVLSSIEGSAAPVFGKLASRSLSLSSEDRRAFLRFLAFGFCRIPKFRDEIARLAGGRIGTLNQELAGDLGNFEESISRVTGFDSENIAELRRAVLAGQTESSVRPELSIGMMVVGALSVSRMLEMMQYSFREAAPSTPIITSDNPVVFNNPSTYASGIADPRRLEVIFPVSPQLVFIATWDGHAGTRSMSPHLSRTINRGIALAADKYVYSPLPIPAIAKYLKQPKPEYMLALRRKQS